MGDRGRTGVSRYAIVMKKEKGSMTTGGCVRSTRSPQDVRRTATPAHDDWLPVAVNQPDVSLFTRNYECQGERYRADRSMNSPSASAQRSVRRRAVGLRLPVYNRRNLSNILNNIRTWSSRKRRLFRNSLSANKRNKTCACGREFF